MKRPPCGRGVSGKRRWTNRATQRPPTLANSFMFLPVRVAMGRTVVEKFSCCMKGYTRNSPVTRWLSCSYAKASYQVRTNFHTLHPRRGVRCGCTLEIAADMSTRLYDESTYSAKVRTSHELETDVPSTAPIVHSPKISGPVNGHSMSPTS